MSDAPAKGGPGAVEQQAAISCRVFSSFEELDVTRDEWDALAQRCGADVFATYDWCRLWWQHFGAGRRLELYVVREEAGLVAVFPLFRETLTLGPLRVSAIRQVGCDRAPGSVSMVADRACLRESLRLLMASLAGDPEPWDVIQIGPLPGHYEGVDELEGFLRSACGELASVESRSAGPHTFFERLVSEDEFLASLSRNQRDNIRKESRRLMSRHRVEMKIAGEPHEAFQAFDRLVELHGTQWRAHGRLGHFGDWPGALAFYREATAAQARRGRAALIEIRADDEVLAVLLGFRFGVKAYALLMGRTLEANWNFASPGRLVLWTAIRNAIASGAKLLDTMHGDYGYERRMGATVGHRTVINIVHCGVASKLLFRVFEKAARLLDRAYYKLYFLRIAPHLGGRRRPLWNKWITTRLMGCR